MRAMVVRLTPHLQPMPDHSFAIDHPAQSTPRIQHSDTSQKDCSKDSRILWWSDSGWTASTTRIWTRRSAECIDRSGLGRGSGRRSRARPVRKSAVVRTDVAVGADAGAEVAEVLLVVVHPHAGEAPVVVAVVEDQLRDHALRNRRSGPSQSLSSLRG